MDVEHDKAAAAEAAAALAEPGMRLGLGTGSTVAHLLPVLAARQIPLRCVATSPRTAAAAQRLGLEVEPFDLTTSPARLDLAIDGADQVASDGWLVKGGGGAHTREKVVAASAERFVVIVDATKLVERLRPPLPLELLGFGLRSTLRRLGAAALRDATPTPDGGVLADYQGPLDDPAALAEWLDAEPGLVDHGLFPPSMIDAVLVGRDGVVERLAPGG
jgi:ribose 5-phosphate isomerase A